MTTVYPSGAASAIRLQEEQYSARLIVALVAAVCVAAVCITARDGLWNLYDRWRYEEEYGYGFLIVALVPFLLWRRWNAIASQSSGTPWLGVAVVAISQICALVAAFGESYFIEQISLVVSLLGIALVLFGSGTIRTFFPIAVLLLLTVPLPYTLQAILTIKLELVSTNLGVGMIQLLGIPVYSDGNVIDLGTYKLQVAEACSGLRYLLPLTCLSFLIAYLYKAPLWKKAVLVALAVPLTIVLNSFRIAVTAVLVNNFGIQMAEGFLHEFEGMVVFFAGVALIGLEIWVLEGFRWSKVNIEPILERQPRKTGRSRASYVIAPVTLALILCAGTLGLTMAADGSAPPVARESLAEFPRHIDRWTGEQQPLDADTLQVLKATDTYNGDFYEGSGIPPTNLFIAYYDSLSKGAAIHSPRVCLPGSGWEFVSFEQQKFNQIELGASGTYNRAIVQKGQQKMLMYYWYQQGARRNANEFVMKYYLLADSFFQHRSDGGLVRVITSIDPDAGKGGVADADARLQAFTRAAISKFPAYLPQ